MRYVMLVVNNDFGVPATIHDSLDDAKAAVRAYLTDPENDPPQDEEERMAMERDLASMDGTYVHGVRGSDAWKEWVYVAPIAETGRSAEPPSDEVADRLLVPESSYWDGSRSQFDGFQVGRPADDTSDQPLVFRGGVSVSHCSHCDRDIPDPHFTELLMPDGKTRPVLTCPHCHHINGGQSNPSPLP